MSDEALRDRIAMAVGAWRHSPAVNDHAFVTTIIDMIHEEGHYKVVKVSDE